jgi:hypothetical protein
MGEIRNSWDYQIILPLVLSYLKDRAWPVSVSSTVIQDHIEVLPEIGSRRIVRIEWDIAHALNDCGYRRVSNTGKGFIKTSLGIQTVPDPAAFRELREISV